VKIAIMQPYFLPYIGYFQLINAVDEFVVYDNIQYTKQSWINRNRILVDGKDIFITLPLRKDSDYLDVRDRYLAENWLSEQNRMLNRVKAAYGKAPYFSSVFPIFERSILFEEDNLFLFIFHSLRQVREYLGIQTPLLVSSSISMDSGLRSENKVVEICKARKAVTYINPIGGVELYSKDRFKKQGLDLYFLKTTEFSYKQFNYDFVPFLSIMDVMMFNSKEEIRNYLNSFYTLL
jgi:hypothetical protein